MRHELYNEQLTVLPKRFETRRWGHGGGNHNFVALNQQNFSAQYAGYGAFQLNDQLNLAVITQH
jgi:hypothetical protein